MAIYRHIRNLHEDHDFIQKQVVEHLGMKQPQYFRYEQGYHDMPTNILVRPADLYQTTTVYGLDRTDKKALPMGGG